MSACKDCDGTGAVVYRKPRRDHEEIDTFNCPTCEGTGRGPCVGCGERSRESDAYCSDRCEREDADRAWESARDGERDDRAAGLGEG